MTSVEEIVNVNEENKTADDATRPMSSFETKSSYLKQEESSEENQKSKSELEAGEAAAAVESEEEEDYQEIALKNGDKTAGPDPPSLSIMADGDSADKQPVGKEGIPEKESDQAGKSGPDKCNLIINYLPPTFTETDVMHYFSPYGMIQQCKVVMDLHTGKSKGYGFVRYETQKSAEKAMEALNGYEIDKKKLKVAVARKHCKEIRDSNLYVTHLPKTLDSKGLEELFKPFGKLVECRVLTDKQGHYRGVGFVRFDMHEHAKQAMLALNKTRPKGWQKELRVKLATKRRDYPIMDWGHYGAPGQYADWWSGFYPPSPSPRRGRRRPWERSLKGDAWWKEKRNSMLPPWAPSPSPRSSHPPPPFFGRRSSPRGRGGFGYYPDYPSPYGYPHPSYSYPPYSSGPGWGMPPHMPMWDHYGCSPRRSRRGGNSYGGRSPRRYANATVIVTNLADEVDEDNLLKIFSELNVDSCKVVRNRGKNSRAFVNFHNVKSAMDACRLDGKVVSGKAMKVNLKRH